MEIFTGQNLLEFAERFKTDEDCKEYLCHIKWARSINVGNVVMIRARLEKTWGVVAILNLQRLIPFSIK